MNSDNEKLTEAQLQIERLKKLKTEREIKEKYAVESVFAENEKNSEPADNSFKEQSNKVFKPATRVLRTARIEKNNFDRLHALVSSVNKNAGKNRTNKDKIINLLIKRFLEIAEESQGLTKEALEELILGLRSK